jgi:hypothetical protein
MTIINTRVQLYQAALVIGALQCVRNLLAVIGLLAVVFLLTLRLSFDTSLRLSGQNLSKVNTVAPENTTAPTGVVVIPLERQ